MKKLIVDNKYNNISDKLKKIRINNTFATAYKKYKDELLNKWSDVIKKAKDDKYGLIDGIINDIDVLVVGEKNIIFLVKYNSLIDRIYNYEEDLKKLLFDVFQKSFDIVFLTSDEWLYEKKKYIDNLKIGEKYQYIIEDNNDDINLDDVTQKNGDSSIEKIISILGNDVIFYK